MAAVSADRRLVEDDAVHQDRSGASGLMREILRSQRMRQSIQEGPG